MGNADGLRPAWPQLGFNEINTFGSSVVVPFLKTAATTAQRNAAPGSYGKVQGLPGQSPAPNSVPSGFLTSAPQAELPLFGGRRTLI